ncbi:MAG: hypothetical protein JSS82_00665 [Bacteroidetes bacterium]|nr:hypothetical protein [Bacteroidota bacterium]
MGNETIKNELERVTTRMVYISESDFELDVQDWGELDETGINKKISQFSGTDKIETVTSDAFFDKTINSLDPADEFAASLGKQYEALRTYLQNNFKEVKVYRSGKIQVHIFIACITETGGCFVVHTISVET